MSANSISILNFLYSLELQGELKGNVEWKNFKIRNLILADSTKDVEILNLTQKQISVAKVYINCIERKICNFNEEKIVQLEENEKEKFTKIYFEYIENMNVSILGDYVDENDGY